MEANNSFDLAVIGSGPGGYVAAIRASQLGLKTAIVEREKLGGICLNWGCIPSKALLTNARIYRSILEAERWGIHLGEISFDFEQIIGRSRKVAETLSKGVAFLMKKNKIRVIQGSARFRSPSQLDVLDSGGQAIQDVNAGHIVVATGARARMLPGIPVDGKRILTYREALVLKPIPESIVIIGAGAIGCEFAYFYNSFGARVTLVEMLDQCLPAEDTEVARELERSFRKQGIEILLAHRVQSAEALETGVRIKVKPSAGKTRTIEAERALSAVGVVGNVEGLNLKEVGIEPDQGRIPVDEWFRTSVKGVYAIGDIIGPPYLAHVASHEGIVCVEKLAGETTHPVDYRNIPSCTYCQPQVASVGLTEQQAVQRGFQIKVGKFPFQVLGKARASQATEGFVKLIFDQQYGELLGAHLIGEEATEMIAELVVAKALETTYLELLQTVHSHPTLSEAVMEAAGAAYGRQLHL